MDAFEFINPVRVIFGNGERKRIGQLLRGRYKKVLLVCSKGPFRTNGLHAEIKNLINEAGVTVWEMGDIDSNPRITSVEEGARICRSNQIECVLALGGGSTMDCSKVIAGAALMDMDPRRFLWGNKVEMKASLDTVMIPTIAATGTELNNTAVIMDEASVSKSWCGAECMFPKTTIIDPEIHASVPLELTVWGAMDILSHTFEFYFNRNESAIFQLYFSEAIIRSAMDCVELLVKDPKDLRARGELAWTSIMAWGGLTKIGRGAPDMACHTVAEGLVPYYDLHHGATLGVITPRWMRHVVDRAQSIFSRFARNVFHVHEEDDTKAARRGVELYIHWLQRMRAPDTLAQLAGKKIPSEKLREIARRILEENHEVGRLVKLGEDDIVSIFEASCVSIF